MSLNRRTFLGLAGLTLLTATQVRAAATMLRPLADQKSFRFGSAIDPADLDRPDVVELFRQSVNSVTPRNHLKWTATERKPGSFDFRGADRIVDFAGENGMRVYGHTLVWYRVPTWVDRLKDKEALQRAMQRHIHTLLTRYKGRIDVWDVVNEPLEYDAAVYRNSVFQRLLGTDHIRMSFDMAREADDRAVLVLNETHLEKAGGNFDAKRAVILKLVEDLVARGTPIQAVGLQAHFRPGLDRLDEEATARFCRALKDMGIGVYITELDVSCHAIKRVKGFNRESYGPLFGDIITVADESGDLKGATVWGLTEKYGEVLKKQKNNAKCNKRINLFDEDNKPRSAVDGIRDALKSI